MYCQNKHSSKNLLGIYVINSYFTCDIIYKSLIYSSLCKGLHKELCNVKSKRDFAF